MTKQIVPAVNVAPFQFKVNEMLSDDPISCSLDLKDDAATACQSYTAWSGYTGSAEQLLQGSADIAYKFFTKSNPALALKVYNGIGIGANIFYGANQQFIEAIKDINKGEPYKPIILPDNPPPFDPKPPTDGGEVEKAIESFWGAFKPWLENIIGKMADKEPNSPWIKILEGVVASSDLWIVQLKGIFNKKLTAVL